MSDPFYTKEEVVALRESQITEVKIKACRHLLQEMPTCWTMRETILAEQLNHFLNVQEDN